MSEIARAILLEENWNFSPLYSYLCSFKKFIKSSFKITLYKFPRCFSASVGDKYFHPSFSSNSIAGSWLSGLSLY